MRLSILHKGHSILQKVQIFFIKTMMDFVPGPVAMLSYRRNFFGKHFAPMVENSLRKAKHWSVGEVELLGTFVSMKNECRYCTSDHRAVTRLALGDEVVEAVLHDYRTAPIDDKMKETLRFLEKLTVTPDELTTSDISRMKEQGLSDEAIEEAMQVCFVFCTINRLADAFDFEMAPDPKKVGRFLFKNGYGVSSLRG